MFIYEYIYIYIYIYIYKRYIKKIYKKDIYIYIKKILYAR